MSTLHALLLFGGVPLLVIVVVSLLVMAPSLAKGPRYRPDQEWDAEPEQFGASPLDRGSSPAGELEAGTASSSREPASTATKQRTTSDDDNAGGASVAW
jgi:hypothetical protein